MIKILCIGKIKEKFYRDAIEEYIKRLGKYDKVEIIECHDYSNLPISDILLKEKQELEHYLNNKDYIITLVIEGKSFNSIEFASKIDNIHLTHNNITFVIGGSYGLHNDIKEMSDLKLSISKMTFPHQLFRVILLEQIYRSFKIINNESYHK